MKCYLCLYLPNLMSCEEPRKKAILQRVGWWAMSLAPLVATDETLPGLILDLSGTEKLYKDREALARKIITELESRKFTARIAIAPTVGSAWGMARCSSRDFISFLFADLIKNMNSLPIEALRLEPETCSALCRLGIYSIEDLLKLPRRKLPARFGPGLSLRIDQAVGRVAEKLCFLHPPHKVCVRKIFAVPLAGKAALSSAVIYLIKQVLLEITAKKQQAGSFIIELEAVDLCSVKTLHRKEISLYAATHDLKHLTGLVQPVIDRWSLPGTIRSIAITALAIQTVSDRQLDFGGNADECETERAGGELLNTLSARLGRENIRKIVFRESYIPERSFEYSELHNSQSGEAPARIAQAHRFNRPPLLLTPPEQCTVVALMPDNPPARLIWRGRDYRIIHGLGPEKIATEWWGAEVASLLSEAPAQREYFKIQCQSGQWLWVFRAADMQWFVHGMWV